MLGEREPVQVSGPFEAQALAELVRRLKPADAQRFRHVLRAKGWAAAVQNVLGVELPARETSKSAEAPGDLLTTAEVAELLRRSTAQVLRLVREGGLPAVSMSKGKGGGYLFPREAVGRWIEQRTLNVPRRRRSPGERQSPGVPMRLAK